jgi:D-alanine-D-alanine ligase
MPRVTILYNEPTLPADHPDADSEHDVLETADVIARHLAAAGLAVSRVGVTADPGALLAGLAGAKPDCVFNLYEGTAGWANSEEYVAGILELKGVPYTGCPTLPMTLARNKPLAKKLFVGAGLPTAPYVALGPGPCPPCPLPWPVIVKPGEQDASVGIDQSSVCENQSDLVARVEYLRRTYGPSVLVERLIVGREFHVPVIERDGTRIVLPYTEILFPPPPDGGSIWPIVTFDAKWKPQSRDFAATPAKNPAEVDDALRATVDRVCLDAFELLGCRDYARVDLRVDDDGRPFVLEMNPNPCINPLAGVAAALETAKIPYAEFLLGCVRNALRRGPRPELAAFEARREGPVRDDGPTSPVVVRPFGPDDGRFADASFYDSDLLTADEKPDLAERLANVPRRAVAVAAEFEGSVAGVASAAPADVKNAVYALDFIGVAGPVRRRGVGSALLTAVERGVAAAGGRLLVADVPSSPGSGPVRQLLARNQYLVSGEVPEYYADGYARLTFSKAFPAVATAAPGGPAASRFPGGGGGLL